MSSNPLPNYPGQSSGAFAKKPLPPKFLEVSAKDGSSKIIKVGMYDEPVDAPQLQIIQPGSLAKKNFPLVSAQLTRTRPAPRILDQEPHRFHAVDSKADCKPDIRSGLADGYYKTPASQQPRVTLPHAHTEANPHTHVAEGKKGKGHIRALGAPIDTVGSTFHHLPNAASLQTSEAGWRVPKLTPSLPRPYLPPSPASFDDYGKVCPSPNPPY